MQDLARTQVDSCDAVFILCNKAPESAKQEDLQTLMACLAIGQYIQVRMTAAPGCADGCTTPCNSR